MKELILPPGIKLREEEPVKKTEGMKPGIAIGLVCLTLGVLTISCPSMVQGRADGAKATIMHRALVDKSKHPEKKIRLIDYATREDIRAIRLDAKINKDDLAWRVCFILSFFFLFPLGITCIAWSVAGCSDMTIGEMVVSGVAGYAGYRIVKRLFK